MLLPRILTALVGMPVFLFLIHMGGWPFNFLTIALAVMALYEYGLILWVGGRGVQRWVTLIGGGILAASVALAPMAGDMVRANFAGMAVTGIILTAVLCEMFRKEHSLDRAALSLFGVFFIGWPLAHLALIRDIRPHGEAWTYLLFVAVWATDIAAYIVGRSMGSRRLAPVLSPKKTWEGAAGGFLAAMLVVFITRAFFLKDVLSFPQAAGIGVLIGGIGQLSDLAESMVKRAVGAKDSSALLPGHGGILDRCDSFLLTAPLLYYALLIKG